jgi:hypothetical protein
LKYCPLWTASPDFLKHGTRWPKGFAAAASADSRTLDNGDILVLAVAHLHRRPDYWRDRL